MPHAASLEGRVAIVTGAGRGIGRATALALAARGASVLVNDLGTALDGDSRSTDPAKAVAAEIKAAGGRAVANSNSVSEWTSAKQIIEDALDQFGQLDLLINNAGLSVTAPIWEQDPDEFDRVVRSHLHGTFFCMRAAAPHMKERGFGRIVNLVSRAGLLGVPNQSAYAAGKGGVFGLTNVASRDLVEFGVAVNAINPAATETRMVTTAIDAFEKQGGAAAKMAAGLAASLQPSENVAHLIVALCMQTTTQWNGETFYLEKDRFGLFDPLEVKQEASVSLAGSSAGTPEGFLEAIANLTPHDGNVVYRDES